jgi:hypothetical protein
VGADEAVVREGAVMETTWAIVLAVLALVGALMLGHEAGDLLALYLNIPIGVRLCMVFGGVFLAGMGLGLR